MVAQTSRARLLSCCPAVSTMANEGRKLCRSSRRCILAAALRLRCLAQSMQLATNWMTVESTAWIPDLEATQQPLPLRPAAKHRTGVLEMPHHRPEQFDDKLRVAILVGVGEAVLGWRGDAEAGKDARLEAEPVTYVVEPMAWESWAKSIAERWLSTLKERALASTPVSRA
jgi:hypothetical protein